MSQEQTDHFHDDLSSPRPYEQRQVPTDCSAHDGGTYLLTLFTLTIHQGGEEAFESAERRHQWYALSQDERLSAREPAYTSCILRAKRCYFAFDFYTKLTSTAESSDNNKTYVLPDENIITVGAERFPFRGSIVPDKILCLRSQRNSQQFFPDPHRASRQHLQVCTPMSQVTRACSLNLFST